MNELRYTFITIQRHSIDLTYEKVENSSIVTPKGVVDYGSQKLVIELALFSLSRRLDIQLGGTYT